MDNSTYCLSYSVFIVMTEVAGRVKIGSVVFDNIEVDYETIYGNGDMVYSEYGNIGKKFLMGICDQNGIVVLEPQYTFLLIENMDFYESKITHEYRIICNMKTYLNGGMGMKILKVPSNEIIDILPCEYLDIEHMINGNYLLKNSKNRVSLVNINNNNISNFWKNSFNKIIYLEEQRFIIQKNNLVYLVDFEGKNLLPKNVCIPNLEDVSGKDSVLLIKKENKYNYCNTSGKILLDNWVEKATPMHVKDCLNQYIGAVIEEKGEWRIVNSKGKIITGVKYDACIYILDGECDQAAWIMERDNKQYFVVSREGRCLEIEVNPNRIFVYSNRIRIKINREKKTFIVNWICSQNSRKNKCVNFYGNSYLKNEIWFGIKIKEWGEV